MAKAAAGAGASAKDIQEAQKLLNKMKDFIVRENGEMDEATVEAVKKFQRQSGMKETGVIDGALLKTLRMAAGMGGPPKYQITLDGKTYLLTDADYKALIERVKKDFRKPMTQLKSAVAEARSIYDDMKKLNDDQYIVSFFVNAVHRTSLPSESLVKNAEALAGGAEKALNNGDFKVLGNIFPKAQTAANEARKAMKDYCSGVIDGAGSIVTGLEFVQAAAFTTVGILAAPVAASYGLGAVAAGVVAGAGTNAVESLAGEVGKAIAGTSEGFAKASLNVLKDTAIGAAVGKLTAGAKGEKLIEKIAEKVARQLTGGMFERASKKVVGEWVWKYLTNNGAAILEGVITDAMKANKSNAAGLTVDAFLQIVAKQVVTAGVFGKFAKLGEVSGKAVMARLSSKTVADLIKQLGPKGSEKALAEIVEKVVEEFAKESGGKVYDTILGALTGKETPEAVEKMIVDQVATNRKLLDSIKDEVEKIARKRK
jgi:peptidoglycan hydrolase-like protein with peptidoglycan-binding domain